MRRTPLRECQLSAQDMANEIVRAHGEAEGSAILYERGFGVRDAMKFATRAGAGTMTMRDFVRILNSDRIEVLIRGKLEAASPRFLGISCGPEYGWELHMASGRVQISDVWLRMRRPEAESDDPIEAGAKQVSEVHVGDGGLPPPPRSGPNPDAVEALMDGDDSGSSTAAARSPPPGAATALHELALANEVNVRTPTKTLRKLLAGKLNRPDVADRTVYDAKAALAAIGLWPPPPPKS